MPARTGLIALVGVLFAVAAPLHADLLYVTVYNDDLALVKEAREIEVPRGIGEFSFTGVPARIDPTSVRLDPGKGGEFAILEQDYRYDLVSREKLLERYLDRTIEVVTELESIHRGVLKSAAGSLVLETEGGVVVLGADKIANLILPEIPEGLITRPTLVWKVENGGSPNRTVEIAYLTGGMSWHAEYVAAVDAKDERMKISGWVSIDNRSGRTYESTRLKVVAGDVHRAMPPPQLRRKGMAMDMMAAPGGFEEREFFEYHIYDLDRITTLADREVKQIQFIAERVVPLEKVYVYEPTRGNDKIQVKLEFVNSEENGLGIPLPAGKFRVYREDADGALEFAGEDRIDHTPRDERVSTYLGNAFDLVGERNEMQMERREGRHFRQRVEIKLRNRKEKDGVTIIVREHPGGHWEVLDSNFAWEKPNAHDLEFEIDVPAGEEVILDYTVDIKY
jgi:hypothetical protein